MRGIVNKNKKKKGVGVYGCRGALKNTRSLTTLHPGVFEIDTVLVFSFKYVPTSLLAWY